MGTQPINGANPGYIPPQPKAQPAGTENPPKGNFNAGNATGDQFTPNNPFYLNPGQPQPTDNGQYLDQLLGTVNVVQANFTQPQQPPQLPPETLGPPAAPPAPPPVPVVPTDVPPPPPPIPGEQGNALIPPPPPEVPEIPNDKPKVENKDDKKGDPKAPEGNHTYAQDLFEGIGEATSEYYPNGPGDAASSIAGIQFWPGV